VTIPLADQVRLIRWAFDSKDNRHSDVQALAKEVAAMEALHTRLRTMLKRRTDIKRRCSCASLPPGDCCYGCTDRDLLAAFDALASQSQGPGDGNG
jgi:hypothetical protein